MSTKSHVIFLLDNGSAYLNEIIFFYILFFTLCSLLFLLNLRFTFNYRFFSHQSQLDIIFMLVVSYLFSSKFVFIVSVIYIFSQRIVDLLQRSLNSFK